MLQHSKPDDYVLATGHTHTVRDFLDEAFGYLSLDWTKYVELDTRYCRPTEVALLLGDPTKAKVVLGWAAKTTMRELARFMVDADLRAL